MRGLTNANSDSLLQCFSNLQEEYQKELLELFKKSPFNVEKASNADFEAFLKWILREEFKWFCIFFVNQVEGQDFEFSLHCQILCEVCQQHSKNNLKYDNDVVINIPPGHSKTTICNILYSAWLLGKDPTHRMIVRTTSDIMAKETNNKTAMIMAGCAYQQVFGSVLLRFLNNLIETQKPNSSVKGYRDCQPMGSRITGRSASFILCFPYEQEVLTNKGIFTIGDIVEKQLPVKVKSWNNDKSRFEWQPISRYIKNESEEGFEMVKVEISDGSSVISTADHKFLTKRGMVEARLLLPTDKIFCNKLKRFTMFYIKNSGFISSKLGRYLSCCSSRVKNVYNLFLRQFAPRKTQCSSFNCISHIFTFCPITKITKAVVSWIRIKMSCFHPFWAFSNKGKKDKTMNIPTFYLSIFTKIYNLVSICSSTLLFVITRVQDFALYVLLFVFWCFDYSIKRSYSAIRARLIKPLITGYVFPNNISHSKKINTTYCISTLLHNFIIVNRINTKDMSWLAVSNCDDP